MRDSTVFDTDPKAPALAAERAPGSSNKKSAPLPDPADKTAFDLASYHSNKELGARNYSYGRIVRWNNAALAPYLPEAAGTAAPAPLIKALRIATQGGGLRAVAAP